MGHLETDCDNNFRDLKHWRKKSILREFVKMQHFARGVSVGMIYKTILDVDDGCGDLAFFAHLKSHPLQTCFIDYSLMCF